MTGKSLQNGEKIGEYEIRGRLGTGGFGEVFLAHHSKADGLYALKRIRSDLLPYDAAREAFQAEAGLCAGIQRHPNIVTLLAAGYECGGFFLVMDLIEPDARGRVSLFDHLNSTSEPFPTNQTLGWAIEFCAGMEHAHANGLRCHRDIKPSNILINRDLRLKIADFGLATAVEAAQVAMPGAKRLTRVLAGTSSFAISWGRDKVRCGTPGYMPPEVYRFERADQRGDIYSFGLVLWQMATGSRLPPFVMDKCTSLESCLRAVYEQQMSECQSRVEEPLGTVVARCLRANPGQRYNSFAELRAALELIWTARTGGNFPTPHADWEYPIYWNNRGITLSSQGRYEEALRNLDQAVAICSRQWSEAALWGDTAKDRARALVRQAERAAWANKSGALLALGRNSEALTCYDQALAIDSGDAKLWNNKAVVLVQLARFEESLACCEMAVACDPKDEKAWTNKGHALAMLRRPVDAIECHDRAIGIHPRFGRAWFNKGTALAMCARHNEAIVCYDKALEINPEDAKALVSKGLTLAFLGHLDEAIKCYDRALTTDPACSVAWKGKAEALGNLGRHSEADLLYQKVLATDPRDAEAWARKGFGLSELDRTEEAMQCYAMAVAVDPGSFLSGSVKLTLQPNAARWSKAIQGCTSFAKLPVTEFNRWVESARRCAEQT